MPSSGLTRGVILSLALLSADPVIAGPGPQTMRTYNNRMQALFVRLDVNGDGRLDAGELRGHRALRRRLRRQKNRSYLLIEDFRPNATGQPSGRRLSKRFRKADRNRDRKLSRVEAQAIPWLGRQFDGIDRNRDGNITLDELWALQRSLAPPQRRP